MALVALEASEDYRIDDDRQALLVVDQIVNMGYLDQSMADGCSLELEPFSLLSHQDSQNVNTMIECLNESSKTFYRYYPHSIDAHSELRSKASE